MNLCIDYEGERGVFFGVSLGLVVELSGLLPRQSLVFLHRTSFHPDDDNHSSSAPMHRCDDMYKCPSTLTSTNIYQCFSKAKMLINVFQKQKQNVKTRLLGLIDKVGVGYVESTLLMIYSDD